MPKLISNEISKYGLKGTVDYFVVHNLTMSAIKIVQILQIHTVLQISTR